MKTFFTLLLRILLCAASCCAAIISGTAAKILADEGSAWYILAVALTTLAIIGAIACTIKTGPDKGRVA